MGTDAQGTRRALALLKVVGAHHAQGLRLTDLLALTGQEKSTLHRQLTALVDEGLWSESPPPNVTDLASNPFS